MQKEMRNLLFQREMDPPLVNHNPSYPVEGINPLVQSFQLPGQPKNTIPAFTIETPDKLGLHDVDITRHSIGPVGSPYMAAAGVQSKKQIKKEKRQEKQRLALETKKGTRAVIGGAEKKLKRRGKTKKKMPEAVLKSMRVN